ncbi:O-sialoglycoprotein endopeptidase [Spironucleus salmonicida]|uniref:18S rRNA aminocarboxypropyltransferase n=1 Tax=Spironucleus salmonicida TaxID=348837 RepID=V6LG27_9EUKA|nr:O-sialoglycoprotein endopeptidase [Spironucleus salmonicida]|eukprot:EST43467.1 putative metal-binding domain in endoribonuclease RNase L inhibitor-containing protein [Spironucleus salmonicida]
MKLFMYDYEQCDPKRCSGQRLYKRNLLEKIPITRPFAGILLSSEGTFYLSQADIALAAQRGLGVVDCSWNEILNHNSVPVKSLKCRNHRRLPFLVAANTVNYGKPMHLNCAEALIAGLYMLDQVEMAQKLSNEIEYGAEFLRINFDSLERYKGCVDSIQVEKAEKYVIEHMGDKDVVDQEQEEEFAEQEEVDYDAIWARVDQKRRLGDNIEGESQ